MKLGRWIASAVMGLTAVGLAPTVAAGQVSRIGQPIYPGYQGFIANEDGSLVLVFQYFSHGRDPVEVPIGPGNHFSGDEDRSQPTTFLPGNHEFVCVIVAENAEAAASLRWTVAFPEAESTTTVDPLNPEYKLEDNSVREAMRDLDLATSPRGVCVNKPPRTRVDTGRRFGAPPAGSPVPELKASLADGLLLKGDVNDEGLPRGGTVSTTWKQVGGPGAVTFADPGAIDTQATFSAPGLYEIELHASDGELENVARVNVRVDEGG